MVLPTDVIAPVRIEVRHGHRLAVRRRGDGGVPLLLIHGFPCTSRIWSHNLVPLAEAGFDVVAPDLRGLFDRLGWDRAIVAGHDLGAMITIHGQPPPRPGGPPGDPGRLQARPG